jgi:hypothetical protein
VFHKSVLNELLQDRVVSGHGRKVPGGVKRKMSNYNLRPRASMPTLRVDFEQAVKIIK